MENVPPYFVQILSLFSNLDRICMRINHVMAVCVCVIAGDICLIQKQNNEGLVWSEWMANAFVRHFIAWKPNYKSKKSFHVESFRERIQWWWKGSWSSLNKFHIQMRLLWIRYSWLDASRLGEISLRHTVRFVTLLSSWELHIENVLIVVGLSNVTNNNAFGFRISDYMSAELRSFLL